MGVVTWNDGTPFVDEPAAGVYAYVQPAGGGMVNNCGIADVAASSFAEGPTPLEAAQKHRDNPYRDWAESERLVGTLHRAYAEPAGEAPDTRITVASVWPDLVAFHGGPIGCHA